MEKLTKELKEITEELDEFVVLNDFEALQIAVKIQQNRILAEAFMVGGGGNYPVALEAIAMGLGVTGKY